MKKYLYLLLVPLCMTLMASQCEDENDDYPFGPMSAKTNYLVGKWHDSYYDGGCEYDVEEYLTFADATGVWEKYYYTESGLLVDEERYIFTYTYNEATKRLTITRKADQIWNFVVKNETQNYFELFFVTGGMYGSFQRK